MKGMRLFVMCLAAVVLVASFAAAEVRLPLVMSDGMVLQRQAEATVWGWAVPCAKVSVRASWLGKKETVEADPEGAWQVKLATGEAGGPYTITISDEDGRKVLSNVLIGEVWVCSGQSNMAFTVRSVINAAEEIVAADYPQIRMFTVSRKVAETPQSDCEGNWQAASAETAGGFSAVGYFFGRYLHKELGVPVGLIHTSWGGTPAEAWTRREILEADEKSIPIVKRYDELVANHPKAMEAYDKKIEAWKEAAKAAKDAGKKAPGKPRQPRSPVNSHTPSGLYNGMIAPLLPYTIKGAVWYQGESNAGRAYQYRTLFPAMIENWRADWGQGCFPFYFVQIAPYKGQNPEIREAQLIAMRNTENTGMVVTTDIGNPNDIHPRNKQDVGKRLGLWALAKSYGRGGIVYSGPLYKGMKVEGDKIRIFFDHVGGGLVAKDGELTYFTIAEEGKDFVAADAVIDGESVVVSSAEVKEPAAVRFGWENSAEPNLFNKAELPASPFRTDDRQGETYGRY